MMVLAAIDPGGSLAFIGLAILWLVVVYLVGLGILILVAPALARRFLGSFAQTSAANWTESVLRALVGVAFVVAAEATRLPLLSLVVGLFLTASALLLVLVPGMHRRFAQRSTRAVFAVFPLLGIGCFLLASALAWLIG